VDRRRRPPLRNNPLSTIACAAGHVARWFYGRRQDARHPAVTRSVYGQKLLLYNAYSRF
jgi:hypothetical protein